ncbi:MAG: DUF4097 family beta strand repeat-containing protein [Candidatus Fimenecus sp.]
MTGFQKAIKYLAMAFALFLIVSILSGIFGALGLVSNVFDNKDAVGEMKIYAVSGDIQELKLDINAAKLKIAESDTFRVESNNKYLKVTEENGCLVITETERSYSNANGKIQVNLYLPADCTFKKANITTGAGQVTVDRLAAEDLYLELGAGQVQIDTLEATRSSKISGGAGQVIVENSTLHNLDLEMGVGELRLTSALTGDCDLYMGVGATNITLIGSADDYRIELDKGVGAATLEGENLPDGAVRGNGANKIDIDGGVGEIRISFAENDAAQGEF